MKKYISEYIREIELYMAGDLEKDDRSGIESVLSEFETKISYFQHERLIHLIVTVLFAILEIMAVFMIMVAPSPAAVLLCIMFLILLVPYVMHYYFLENSVQKMYKMRDRMRESLNKNK
ncbi:MAG: hypothetical protein J5883_00405 [Clostridiales bacterium]|nr:hypothetical protein [Clostridiales bacterium]